MRLIMFAIFPASFRAGITIDTEGIFAKLSVTNEELKINGLATAIFNRQKFLKIGNGAIYLLKKLLNYKNLVFLFDLDKRN